MDTGPDSTKLVVTWAMRILFTGIGFIGLVLGGLAMDWWTPLDGFPMRILLYGSGVGVVILGSFLVAAMALRRFAFEKLPVKALLGIIPVVAALVLGMGIMATLNGAFDSQGLRPYETVVVNKESRTGKNSGAWFEVRDFRPGRRDKLLRVQPGELFDQVNEGDRIVVMAGSGLFEWWYREVRLVPQQTKAPTAPEAAPAP